MSIATVLVVVGAADAQDVELSTADPAFAFVAPGDASWFPDARLLYLSKEQLADLGIPRDVSEALRALARLLPPAYSRRVRCEVSEDEVFLVHHELEALLAERWLAGPESPLWQSLRHLVRLPPDFADSGRLRKREWVIGVLLCAHYRIERGEPPPTLHALARELREKLSRTR